MVVYRDYHGCKALLVTMVSLIRKIDSPSVMIPRNVLNGGVYFVERLRRWRTLVYRCCCWASRIKCNRPVERASLPEDWRWCTVGFAVM